MVVETNIQNIRENLKQKNSILSQLHNRITRNEYANRNEKLDIENAIRSTEMAIEKLKMALSQYNDSNLLTPQEKQEAMQWTIPNETTDAECYKRIREIINTIFQDCFRNVLLYMMYHSTEILNAIKICEKHGYKKTDIIGIFEKKASRRCQRIRQHILDLLNEHTTFPLIVKESLADPDDVYFDYIYVMHPDIWQKMVDEDNRDRIIAGEIPMNKISFAEICEMIELDPSSIRRAFKTVASKTCGAILKIIDTYNVIESTRNINKFYGENYEETPKYAQEEV